MTVSFFIFTDYILGGKRSDIPCPVLFLNLFFCNHFKSLVIRQISGPQTLKVLLRQFIRRTVFCDIKLINIIV